MRFSSTTGTFSFFFFFLFFMFSLVSFFFFGSFYVPPRQQIWTQWDPEQKQHPRLSWKQTSGGQTTMHLPPLFSLHFCLQLFPSHTSRSSSTFDWNLNTHLGNKKKVFKPYSVKFVIFLSYFLHTGQALFLKKHLENNIYINKSIRINKFEM